MKILGVKDVNKMLPLLKPITKDIQETWGVIKAQKIEMEDKKKKGEKYEDILTILNKNVDKINYYIKEVQGLNGLVAHYQNGEIDFASLYQGRKVFLCVKPMEEKEVQFFHEIDEVITDRVEIDKNILETRKVHNDA